MAEPHGGAFLLNVTASTFRSLAKLAAGAACIWLNCIYYCSLLLLVAACRHLDRLDRGLQEDVLLPLKRWQEGLVVARVSRMRCDPLCHITSSTSVCYLLHTLE